jgi:hypothetical protein
VPPVMRATFPWNSFMVFSFVRDCLAGLAQP